VPVKQLRIVSTVLLAFAVGQAGLGSGYLEDGRWLLVAHAINAFAVLLLAILAAVFGLIFRRSGGPSWTFYFPLTLVIIVGIQIGLGFAGVRSVHVFLGVLLISAITMFCSYSWRLQPPVRGTTPVVAEA
jgi:uncharacterized membrane protein AbrB (regulator of aidB expression)